MKLIFRKTIFLSILCQSIAGGSLCAFSNVEKYHALINKAELAIVDNKPREALSIYDTAFRVLDPFAIDVQNALFCALDLKLSDRCVDLCKRLAAKGVGPSYFRRANFRLLQNHPDWSQLMLLASSTFHKYEEATKPKRKQLEQLHEADQKNALDRRKLGNNTDRCSWIRVENTQDSINLLLVKYCRENGVISERSLGPAMTDDTILTSNFPFDVMMVHCFQKGRIGARVELSSMLLSALKEGLLSPNSFSILFTMSSAFDSRLEESRLFVVAEQKLFRGKFSPEEEWKIDRIREEFFLCPLADLERKVAYKTRNPESPFKVGFVAQPLASSFKNDEERIFFQSHFKEVGTDYAKK